MSAHVLIFGGSGMLGKPVTREFIARGHRVSVVTTHPDKTSQLFNNVTVIEGDITKPETIKDIFDGIDWVYLNLNAKMDPELYQAIEIDGTRTVASLAKQAGVSRIGLISGASSKGIETGVIYRDAKVKAERALIDSGIPYHIFRPSWFYESLPHFIQQERAVILGEQPLEISWLSADDYANQVVNAYERDNTTNKAFYNLGPEKYTMEEALALYCEYREPNLEPTIVSFTQAKMLAMLPGMKELKKVIPFFEYFTTVDEDVDRSETDTLLSANETKLRDWLKQ